MGEGKMSIGKGDREAYLYRAQGHRTDRINGAGDSMQWTDPGSHIQYREQFWGSLDRGRSNNH